MKSSICLGSLLTASLAVAGLAACGGSDDAQPAPAHAGTSSARSGDVEVALVN